MTETISTFEAERRLRVLAKSGFGAGLPRRRNDRWILLFSARAALPTGERWNEKTLNELLAAWLARLGGRLELDHVTLRRALIDEGFLERVADGSRYWTSTEYERHVRFVASAPASDAQG
jgi:hypothetical protein